MIHMVPDPVIHTKIPSQVLRGDLMFYSAISSGFMLV